MKRTSIVIPAYNEAGRIGRTLQAYSSFFKAYKKSHNLDYELVVVLNGCVDNTRQVVEQAQAEHGNIIIIDEPRAGKGLAVKLGFCDALTRPNDTIGFVDADMSTLPEDYAALLTYLSDYAYPGLPAWQAAPDKSDYDGVIANRYMAGSVIYPQRPFIKKWGRKLVYHSLIRYLFGLSYSDYQCGAKIFTRQVIEKVAPQLQIAQWAFDVELLYLCKKYGYRIKEAPTVWRDQADSKLQVMRAGTRMLGSLFEIRKIHG